MSITLNVKPKLNIDRVAEILGVHPLYFNCLDAGSCIEDLERNACDTWWNQYTYQSNGPFSKEQLAYFIKYAEDQIENYLGYFVAPTWVSNETHEFPYYHRREYGRAGTIRNIKFLTEWKNVLAFGQREEVLVGNFPVAYSDIDIDGFRETATITFSFPPEITSNLECPESLKIYVPGVNGNEYYELRNQRSISYDAATNVGTIVFDSWILLDPEIYLTKSFSSSRAHDACDPGIFLPTVDIYLERVNQCAPQVELVWSKARFNPNRLGLSTICYQCAENCNCEEYVVPGCVKVSDWCEGLFNIEQLSYDPETGCVNYDRCPCPPCEMPDYIRVNYLSGCKDKRGCNRPCEELTKAIVMLGITNLPNVDCSCKCIQQQLTYWHTSYSLRGQGLNTYNMPLKLIETNPFGSDKLGAIEAAAILNMLKEKPGHCGK